MDQMVVIHALQVMMAPEHLSLETLLLKVAIQKFQIYLQMKSKVFMIGCYFIEKHIKLKEFQQVACSMIKLVNLIKKYLIFWKQLYRMIIFKYKQCNKIKNNFLHAIQNAIQANAKCGVAPKVVELKEFGMDIPEKCKDQEKHIQNAFVYKIMNQ